MMSSPAKKGSATRLGQGDKQGNIEQFKKANGYPNDKTVSIPKDVCQAIAEKMGTKIKPSSSGTNGPSGSTGTTGK